jgi:tRNA pseudouridine38-40 synthase
VAERVTTAPREPSDPLAASAPTSPRARGVLLEVAYRGTRYSGFAAQRDVPTIEGELSRALRVIDPTASSLRFASRTDAGVHADGNIVSFDAELALPPRGWLQTLNRELPDDIAVRRVRAMPPGFNPRFASRSKRYRYSILLDKVRDPAWADRAWRVGYEVRLDALEAECGSVLGTHDFAAFRGAGDLRENTVRTLTRVELVRTGDPRLVQLVVEGSAFLYNMVRIVAGSLVDVGRAHLARGGLARALITKDRRDLGQTAPAHGLCLEHVDYILPDDVPAATSERDITPWPS